MTQIWRRKRPSWPKRPVIIVIDSATYLLTISSPNINKVAMNLYNIISVPVNPRGLNCAIVQLCNCPLFTHCCAQQLQACIHIFAGIAYCFVKAPCFLPVRHFALCHFTGVAWTTMSFYPHCLDPFHCSLAGPSTALLRDTYKSAPYWNRSLGNSK